MLMLCVVGYKTGVTERSIVYGRIFSELDTCCDGFKHWFHNTGNKKVIRFEERGAPFDGKEGLNFVSRGDRFLIELQGNGVREQVKFCPFCGAKIEIRETGRVKLVPKQKTVDDGFEEQKIE